MRNRWMVFAALAALAGSPLAAQRTADQARLSLGLHAGATAGTKMWNISGQPIVDAGNADTVALARRIKGSLAVVFHGTYFPGESWGFTGEAMLIGLGQDDECRLTFASGSTRNQQVCNSITQGESPSSAVALSVGMIYRAWSRRTISPYGRIHAGMVVSQQSTVQMNGFYRSDSLSQEETRVTIYDDPDSRQLTPVLGVAVGFTAALGRGYQLRWEVRDNMVGVEEVTGTTFGAPREEPPHSLTFKHVFSVTFGFDVLLERRRGRRY